MELYELLQNAARTLRIEQVKVSSDITNTYGESVSRSSKEEGFTQSSALNVVTVIRVLPKKITPPYERCILCINNKFENRNVSESIDHFLPKAAREEMYSLDNFISMGKPIDFTKEHSSENDQDDSAFGHIRML